VCFCKIRCCGAGDLLFAELTKQQIPSTAKTMGRIANSIEAV
jgi:hypothetical protein